MQFPESIRVSLPYSDGEPSMGRFLGPESCVILKTGYSSAPSRHRSLTPLRKTRRLLGAPAPVAALTSPSGVPGTFRCAGVESEPRPALQSPELRTPGCAEASGGRTVLD